MAKVETDMLHGPLLGKIVMFALPYAATGILQQLFNSINVFVVGRFDSSHAMAAVGATTFLINLIINLFLGVSVGANAVIANNIGRRDPQAVHRAVSTTAALSLIGGAILLVVGLLVATPLLRLLGTPADVIHDSALYLNICFLGAPFFMVYNFGAAIFRSKGDTRTPLYILAVAGVINVVVSMVTVIVFHMSVAGVACAYFVSNMFSAVVITTLLWREKGEFRVRLRQIRIYRKELGDILAIGLPAGLQATVFSFSNVFVQSSINKFGYAAIAGASLSITFDTYCYYVLTAFCATAITFTGQNYGAGQVDRCRRIFRLCFLLGGASIFTANMVFVLFGPPIASVFTTDPQVVHYCTSRIYVALAFQWIATSYEIPAACMRGLGISLAPALLTIFGTCFIRLGWIFLVLPHWYGYEHLMLCYPISWVITGVLVSSVYVAASRKAYRLLAP
ncbi:MAG: MATE family efflux transporter [Prevotella sp.]|uniref:MATE family efflux transporter n=1 Tax=Hallella sp. TaxID=2980186 RepID=UPI002A90E733|nr:MATE family efflux transporter [Hallella sp.]MCI7433504.1 MATE family efflux transporter [Prevotella sp.]MDY5925798.1 MATE family efflux transporter [Hallella sp.]